MFNPALFRKRKKLTYNISALRHWYVTSGVNQIRSINPQVVVSLRKFAYKSHIFGRRAWQSRNQIIGSSTEVPRIRGMLHDTT